MTNILFSVVKDEAPFILEWIAYHRQLGFDRIVIYSNNCSDGTDTLLDELAKFDVITHVPHDPGNGSPQGQAARLFTDSRIYNNGDYLMWMDADEFLNVKIGDRSLNALIARIADSQGMPVPWRIFGDSGHLRHVGRQVCKEYTCASELTPETSRLVKTIFRVSDEFQLIRVHAPLFSPEFWADGGSFMSSTGKPLDMSLPPYQGWAAGGPMHLVPEDNSYDIAQINHYLTRSKPAFVMKHRRGNGGNQPSGISGSRERYELKNFNMFNYSPDRDETIFHYIDATDVELARLSHLGEVGKISLEIEKSFREKEEEIILEHGWDNR